MVELILICMVVVGLIGILVVINHNKFKFAIIKIEEAENNIDVLLQKKLDLLNRASSVIKKELKLETFLDNLLEVESKKLNHFQLNDLLNESTSQFYKTLDDNEKLYKSESLNNIILEFKANNLDLVAAVKFYNDAVVIFNKLRCSFPSNLIGFLFRYKKKEFYNNEKKEMYEILNDNEM